MNIQRVLALLLTLSLRMVAQQGNAHTTPKPDERLKADVLLSSLLTRTMKPVFPRIWLSY